MKFKTHTNKLIKQQNICTVHRHSYSWIWVLWIQWTKFWKSFALVFVEFFPVTNLTILGTIIHHFTFCTWLKFEWHSFRTTLMAIDCMPIFQNIYNFICIYNFDDWPLIGGVYAGSTPPWIRPCYKYLIKTTFCDPYLTGWYHSIRSLCCKYITKQYSLVKIINIITTTNRIG